MDNKKAIILTIGLIFIIGLILDNSFFTGSAIRDADNAIDDIPSYRLTSVIIITIILFIIIYLINKKRKIIQIKYVKK